MGSLLSSLALPSMPKPPTLKQLRVAILGEPDDEMDAAPREAYTLWIWLLTLLPRRNLKTGARVLSLRDPYEDDTDMTWYNAVVVGKDIDDSGTTYYDLRFFENEGVGEDEIESPRMPHHRLVRLPFASKIKIDYRVEPQHPSMLGLDEDHDDFRHRFRKGDVVKHNGVKGFLVVTDRRGDFIRLESKDEEGKDKRDMFFPERHAWLTLKTAAPDDDLGDPDHDSMTPPSSAQDAYNTLNAMLPSVKAMLTPDMFGKILRHVKKEYARDPTIIRKAVDPAHNPKRKYGFLHWVARKDMNGYYRVADLLFQHGASPDPFDFVGLTPLYNACVYAASDVARFLLQNGADPLIPAPGLLTPVHLMLSDRFNVSDSLAEMALRKRRTQKKDLMSASKDVTFNFKWLDYPRIRAPKNFFISEHDTGAWANHVGGESALHVIIKGAHLGALGTPLIAKLLEHKWTSFAGSRSRMDAMMALALAMAVVADTFLHPHREGTDVTFEEQRFAGFVVTCVLVVWSGLLVCSEIYDILSDRELWFLDLWNPWEMATYSTTLLFSAGDLAEYLGYLSPAYEGWVQLLQALSAFFVWVRLLKYVAIFERVGHLVNVILKMLSEFIVFLSVFAAIFFGFTHALYVLMPPTGSHGPKAVLEAIMIAFQMMIGEFDYELYEHRASLIVLFVAYILIAMILMLNLLIAQLSNVYAEVQNDASAQFMLNRARLTLEKEKGLSRRQRRQFSARTIKYEGTSIPQDIATSIIEEEARDAAERQALQVNLITRLQLEERDIAAAKDPDEVARERQLRDKELQRYESARRNTATGNSAGAAAAAPNPAATLDKGPSDKDKAMATVGDGATDDAPTPRRFPRMPRPCFGPMVFGRKRGARGRSGDDEEDDSSIDDDSSDDS